ncbi:hypothetical protein PCS_03407 [Desulfocurvibacter africanus PCS]|uniref:Uncharacterized protein n=1 Tax=Desulfocurvibacter africanus PCS TaxID=1262666 RepID=M5Q0S0_DESAF|nr:hypothetical protein [Desulfocurvibacter africanus]EMG35923.1 hypothetical protein PCS_03407 [Desulfocurvibacter africanus PCS]
MAQDREQHPGTEDLKTGGRDLSKVAMLVAALSFVLLVVFFFSIYNKMTNISERVEALSQIQEKVASVEYRMGQVDMRMDQLAELPEQARRQAHADSLAEMSGRLDGLAEQLGDGQEAQTLERVKQLLAEVREGLQQ